MQPCTCNCRRAAEKRLRNAFGLAEPWIKRHAVDYIQPDVTKCGGLSEEYKIATLAYENGVCVRPLSGRSACVVRKCGTKETI